MDRQVSKLSAAAVKAAAPGMHGDGGGLWLHVSGRTSKSWIFRFTSPIDGKPHEMGLGPLHTLSLAEARIKALDCRRQVLEGRDPLADRKAQRRAARVVAVKEISFRECAEAYIEANEKGWRNAKHRAQWPSTLERYVYPVFGAMPVKAIDVDLVRQVIEPLWNHKTETASRVLGRIEMVLDWATVNKRRSGDNPARWHGYLDKVLPAKTKVRPVVHHRALRRYAEIAGFVDELRQREGVAARALEFLILTAGRTGEVLGATWREIDEERRQWTIPAARMKAARDHEVPLSAPALAILHAMKEVRQDDFVFPSARPGRPLSNMALLAVLGRMGRGDLTAHGFRSTFLSRSPKNSRVSFVSNAQFNGMCSLRAQSYRLLAPRRKSFKLRKGGPLSLP
ncbi:MAG: integrase arm-type DNA-binding domain-containing protein [Stellaceae bacterium]